MSGLRAHPPSLLALKQLLLIPETPTPPTPEGLCFALARRFRTRFPKLLPPTKPGHPPGTLPLTHVSLLDTHFLPQESPKNVNDNPN